MRINPPTLYRYTERRWAEDLTERGRLRLKPLTVYQAWEAKDVARADPGEGKATRYSIGESFVWNSPEEQDPFFRQFMKLEGGGRAVVINASFQSHLEAPASWIYCMSDVLSAKLLRGFDGADTVVRIHRVRDFMKAITLAIAQHITGGALDRCLYVPARQIHYTVPNVHASHVKSTVHAWQHEVRAYWESATANIKDLDVEAPDIVGTCSIVPTKEVEAADVPL